jgi:serine/threonine protein kinase
MGEVYRARDTRLGRDVALKFLPAGFANDPARRQRFELEARAVAALTHPNIVAVYDVGDGYIVSELVDGEPLRAGKFGPRKTIELAVQIAGGLACAHDAGITHRDLKPANILVTRDGRAKILDFGLAKIAAQPPAAGGATQTMGVNTEPGVVMGTVGYMSPEQVRGRPADSRSDIFSFGVILYELLAGKRAFSADTSAETMTAILKHEPPDLPETVPAGIRQVVASCLEKDPALRLQSAHDLSLSLSALSQAGTGSGPAKAVPARSKARSIAIAAASAATLLLGGILVGHLAKRDAAAPGWSAVMLGGPERATYPRPSPDGHLLPPAGRASL